MVNISIFEDIGGFLISPSSHAEHILAQKTTDWRIFIIQSSIFLGLSSIFGGCVMMFYMMYPEVFWVPRAFHTGELFLYAAASPLFILSMFGLGIILVVIYDFFLHGSLSYILIRTATKSTGKLHSITYWRYMAIFSYTHIFTTLFHIIIVLWIYFFEKFSYTKIFFPVTDLTLPVIIQLSILSVCVILKWVWEFLINRGIFRAFKTSNTQIRTTYIFLIGIKLILTVVVLLFVYLSGNLIAGAQWS